MIKEQLYKLDEQGNMIFNLDTNYFEKLKAIINSCKTEEQLKNCLILKQNFFEIEKDIKKSDELDIVYRKKLISLKDRRKFKS